jgi:hypothetical protein
MSLFFRAIFVTLEVRVSININDNACTKRSKKRKYVEGPARNVKAYGRGTVT